MTLTGTLRRDHWDASRVYPISIAPHRTETRPTGLISELNHFTSACGQSVYTGGGFPADYQGAYFAPSRSITWCMQIASFLTA